MENKTYLSDEDYDFIYSRVPRICVDLLVKNDKGQVLLTQRTIEPYINHWHFPGGRIKFRESIEDAAKRIAKGELGLNVDSIGTIVGTCQFPEEYQKGQPRHSISIVHEITLLSGIELNAQDKYQWFEVMPDPVIPPQKDFLIQNGYIK
jgi:ADP-ribose pyrophosphatase YjhB (NUDIX family)